MTIKLTNTEHQKIYKITNSEQRVGINKKAVIITTILNSRELFALLFFNNLLLNLLLLLLLNQMILCLLKVLIRLVRQTFLCQNTTYIWSALPLVVAPSLGAELLLGLGLGRGVLGSLADLLLLLLFVQRGVLVPVNEIKLN